MTRNKSRPVRIYEPQRTKIEKQAKKENRTIAGMVNHAVKKYLELANVKR